jgi:carbonic anhydrase/acetyltransferase-like protein (isoleucine patch superfamily)
MHYQVEFRSELIDPSAFIAPTAIIRGNVTLGVESSVWFQSVLRGDTESIRVGQQTNIQDLCLLHADPGFPCLIGNRVTLGHGAMVHGATVEDDCLIGMRAVVMNGAYIGAGSLIGVGAVVLEGTHIPPRSLVIGLPGKIVRPTSQADLDRIQQTARHYCEAAKQYRG